MLRQDDFLKGQLVSVMYTHGKEYGGHLPACMIGSCLMNRVKAGWGTLLEVIERIPIFAATKDLPVPVMPLIWDAAFVKLLHEVEGIFDGTQNYAKDAKYWCDTRRVDTEFFKEKILGNPDHPRVVEQNSLAFFR